MNTNNIKAATLARIAAADAMSYEAGAAVAQAFIEATTEVASFKPGQVVRLATMPNARRVVVLSVAANGIWIRRTATEGEFARRGVEQVKERVSIKQLIAS